MVLSLANVVCGLYLGHELTSTRRKEKKLISNLLLVEALGGIVLLVLNFVCALLYETMAFAFNYPATDFKVPFLWGLVACAVTNFITNLIVCDRLEQRTTTKKDRRREL